MSGNPIVSSGDEGSGAVVARLAAGEGWNLYVNYMADMARVSLASCCPFEHFFRAH